MPQSDLQIVPYVNDALSHDGLTAEQANTTEASRPRMYAAAKEERAEILAKMLEDPCSMVSQHVQT